MISLPDNPKIALVHDWLTVPGGAESVLEEIYSLFPGTVFCSQFDRERFPGLREADVRPTVLQRLPFSLKRHYLYAPLMPAAYRALDLTEFDLVLADSHSFAHQARGRADALHVCYYHTPARSLWFPEIDGRASTSTLRRALARRLRALDLDASRNADVILANSETTAQRVAKVYGRAVERVIYPPVDTQPWATTPISPTRQGFVIWGRLVPYKRVDVAIDACRLLGVPLHVVGSGPEHDRLRARAEGDPSITFHGRLEATELRRVLGTCEGALFPGYEDFGIVPIEAMAAGLPVVAFDAGGASETVLPPVGERFSPQTPHALAAAIQRLRMRSFDPQELQRHASRFDRTVFRAQYTEAITQAWETHRHRPHAATALA